MLIGATAGLLAAIFVKFDPSVQIPTWGAMRNITFQVGIDLIFLPVGGALAAFIFELWWHVVRRQQWYFKAVVVTGIVVGGIFGCLIGLNIYADTAWLLEAGIEGLLIGMALGGLAGFGLLCLDVILFLGG